MCATLGSSPECDAALHILCDQLAIAEAERFPGALRLDSGCPGFFPARGCAGAQVRAVLAVCAVYSAIPTVIRDILLHRLIFKPKTGNAVRSPCDLLMIQYSDGSSPLRLFPDQPYEDHHHADTDGGSRNLSREPHHLLRVCGHGNIRGHDEKEYKRKHQKEHTPTDHPPIDPSHIILLQLSIGIKFPVILSH